MADPLDPISHKSYAQDLVASGQAFTVQKQNLDGSFTILMRARYEDNYVEVRRGFTSVRII